MALPFHDPNDVLDYGVLWEDWLPFGDTIVSSTWIVPAGIDEDEAKRSHTTMTTTLWLTGGTPGQTYRVTNQITTAQGRTKQRSLDIPVRDL